MESLERPDGFRDPVRRTSTGVRLRERPTTRREEYPALPARLRAGDRLDGHLVIRLICGGSHSTILEAMPASGGRPVALKVLGSHLALSSREVDRFRREAELARRVRHPSLLPVYHSGDDRGHYFYAMRLESGRTVEDLVPLATESRDESFFAEIAERFVPLARAVHELHRAGVTHRDIKPSNILLDSEGMYVLSDFGSAVDRDRADEEPERDAGGTVLYMSPEQLRPGADLHDPSGDVYSLGMTLYEACTGQTAFPLGPDAEIARLKVTRLPPPPRRVNPCIPMALDSIIRRSIDTHRSLRFDSADELARELDRFAWRRRTSPPRRSSGAEE